MTVWRRFLVGMLLAGSLAACSSSVSARSSGSENAQRSSLALGLPF